MTTTTRDTYTPPNLKGKELEKLVLHRADSLKSDGLLMLNRNEMKSSQLPDGKIIRKKSHPDFGGLVRGGTAMSVECKVEKGASLPLHTQKKQKFRGAKPHQIDHLMDISRLDGLAYLLIHFNLNVLKVKTHDEFTVAVPVSPEMEFWKLVDRGEMKSLNRDVAREIGILVPWNYHSSRVRTLTPDLRVLIPGHQPERW